MTYNDICLPFTHDLKVVFRQATIWMFILKSHNGAIISKKKSELINILMLTNVTVFNLKVAAHSDKHTENNY